MEECFHQRHLCPLYQHFSPEYSHQHTEIRTKQHKDNPGHLHLNNEWQEKKLERTFSQATRVKKKNNKILGLKLQLTAGQQIRNREQFQENGDKIKKAWKMFSFSSIFMLFLLFLCHHQLLPQLTPEIGSKGWIFCWGTRHLLKKCNFQVYFRLQKEFS